MKKERPPLFGEEDLLSSLIEKKGPSLFLGRYSLGEAIAALAKRGFFKEARKRSLWPLTWDLDSSAHPVQRFRIFYEAKKPENLIVDLKIREGRLARKDYLHLPEFFFECEFLILEWLTLQNPRLGFSAESPPLPGQDHPGLGLGKKVVDIFVYLARLTHKAGIVASPAYFHNALLFCRYFRFLNPEKCAEVLAIQKAFPKVPFKHLTWIVHLHCLRQDEGKVYEWKAEEQVYPLNKLLRDYLDSTAYNRRLKQSLKKWRFTIDWNCYEKKLNTLLGGRPQN